MKIRLELNFILFSCACLISGCNFDKMYLRPDKYPQGFNKIIFKTTDDTIIVRYTGSSHQPVFTNKNGRDTVKLKYTIETVMFKSTSGNLLNGWILKPIGQTPTVTLLHLHGNGGSLFTQYKAMSPLLKNGFQIFMFDYSGFGFSSGKATRENTLNDALSALDYLKTRTDLTNMPLVVYGQSYGGHLAAVLAEKREQELDALVIEGAFSSAKDIASDRAGFFGRVLVKQGFSALNSIAKFQKPVLIIHSTEDKVVPFYMGQKLFAAANSRKAFYEIKNCHICGPKFYTGEISEKIKEMLK